MQGFLITLAACSVTMSALALFYMAVTPLLAKRYSITGRYYAWLVIVLGLIIPFRPRSGNAVVKVHVPVNKPVPFIRTGTERRWPSLLIVRPPPCRTSQCGRWQRQYGCWE